MRIAYFSPLNPQTTGIADYSEELLPYLAQHAEIDIFVDGYTPTNHELTANFPIYDYRQFESLRTTRRYDAPLYQMGNSPFHEYIYRTLVRFPGITVLHDYVLHHFIVGITVGNGDEASYIREMGYCHGYEGANAARRALRCGHQFPYLQYPVNRRLVDASFGLIVHNNYVQSLIAAYSPAVPVAKINHHLFVQEIPESKRDLRRSLGLEEEALVFGSFGFATPEKRLEVALRAFHRVRERFPHSLLLIVGEVPSWHNLQQTVLELGLQDGVECSGYVKKEDLLKYVAAIDVGLSLRWPTMGETSGSLLRLLGAGKATIVSDVGSYAELPNDCCQKVPVGEDEEKRLLEAMLSLARDAEGRQSMGQRARHYVREHHAIEKSAAQYIGFIEKVLA